MTSFGKNMLWTVEASQRAVVRRGFESVLGCARRSPTDALDLFDFEDQAMVGVAYKSGDSVLSPAQQHDAGAWLEFFVSDPEAASDALVREGFIRVTDGHTPHPYVQVPGGGPVFRLARQR